MNKNCLSPVKHCILGQLQSDLWVTLKYFVPGTKDQEHRPYSVMEVQMLQIKTMFFSLCDLWFRVPLCDNAKT
jgi:hypothetical protein